ncbi:MAG: heme exporter protein CcmB [Pseudomonadota bacterium]
MRSLFERDLRLALRSGGGAGLSLGFYLIAVTLLAFGIGPDRETLAAIAPGALWVLAALACLLSIDRMFQPDYEDGALDQIALGPIPLESAALAKAGAHWVTTGLPVTLAAPALGITLQLPEAAIPSLVATLLIGTPALSLLGAIGAALTIGVRRGGLLLTVLVLPLYIPTLIFGSMCVRAAALGLETLPALSLLAAVTLVCLAGAPFAAAAALRANLR